jgi:hypothetical protein
VKHKGETQMAAKLNQIIALVNGKKTRTQKNLTEVYHNLQKPTLFDGISRVYEPDTELGETQPPEKKLIQYKVSDALLSVRETVTDLLDATATQDYANCKAKADVKVDGKVVLKDVPVTYLLFLEKQLIDLHTFVGKLPTLDPADKWEFSEQADAYVSEKSVRNSTKKVLRNHVKSEATEKHPAQVETFSEDVKVGEWHTIKFSGAIPAKRKNILQAKVEALQEAVKVAREEANSIEVETVKVGESVFKFLFD